MSATPRYVVRDWTARDTDALCTWFATDDTMWRYMPGIEAAPSEATLRAHLAERLAQHARGEALVLAIGTADDVVLAGQFILHPLLGAEGNCHLLVAPRHQGHGVAVARCGIQAAQARGVRKIIGIPSSKLPMDVYLRFMRRVGFTIRFYGEIQA